MPEGLPRKMAHFRQHDAYERRYECRRPSRWQLYRPGMPTLVKPALSRAWQPAVEEVIEEYFKAARHSFQNGESMEGVETLTDAVRATLGRIAATRNWPHSTHEDLYSIAAALGGGTGWPDTMEEFEEALNNRSEDGKYLGSALGACMGRPDMLRFGVYAENPNEAEEDGFLFATTTIELANRLAGQTAP